MSAGPCAQDKPHGRSDAEAREICKDIGRLGVAPGAGLHDFDHDIEEPGPGRDQASGPHIEHGHWKEQGRDGTHPPGLNRQEHMAAMQKELQMPTAAADGDRRSMERR